MPQGMLALVGSGEYTLNMLDAEKKLLESGERLGKTGGYVQFATAAGLESESSISYWKELGAKQAERIGVPVKFVEVFNREDADDSKWIEMVDDASLIYFSGGNPKHVAQVFRGTKLWEKIISEYRTGTSLAGCSAGAMMMGEKIAFPIHIKNMEDGLNLVSNLVVLPHYDRYFGRIPRFAQNFIFSDSSPRTVIGIDENTSLINDGENWEVSGLGGVHLISESPKISFASGEFLPNSLLGNPN